MQPEQDVEVAVGKVFRKLYGPVLAAPKLVTREMLGLMKPGSVVVDVAVDQGGCFETTRPTTHDEPTFVVDDVEDRVEEVRKRLLEAGFRNVAYVPVTPAPTSRTSGSASWPSASTSCTSTPCTPRSWSAST